MYDDNEASFMVWYNGISSLLSPRTFNISEAIFCKLLVLETI